MPTRANAIVTCSCGKKFGNAERGDMHDDMFAVELRLLELAVPRMKRHWELQHTLKLRDGLPLAYAAVIAKAAREMAEAEEPATASVPSGLLRSDPESPGG